ncbi:hypothetical protein [Xanthomonas sp. WHRI 8370]|uniref:hypothetical protein n=1 Tax=Xanthomonas sp. WHRI 8370 TaxID=3161572 RepID=UPI0032E8A7D9
MSGSPNNFEEFIITDSVRRAAAMAPLVKSLILLVEDDFAMLEMAALIQQI